MTSAPPTPDHEALTPRQAGERAADVLAEITTAVVGKPEPLALVMLGILAGGHVLIEDLPGLGKTLLARSFATSLGLDFRRIQFTPDLLPSDVTGAPFYDQRVRRHGVPARAGVHQPAARRRDQPHPAQDPGGAAGGHGRVAGVRRRQHPPRCPTRSW